MASEKFKEEPVQPVTAETPPSGNDASPTQHRGVSPALILFLIFPVIGIAAAVITALSTSSSRDSALPAGVRQSPPKLMNWEAPDFELRDLAGSPVKLTDFHGRPVFLNFWATWCAPCVEELPAFQTFMQQQGDSGAVVLAVNSEEPPELIQKFLTENGISGLRFLLDDKGTARRQYSILNLPTTYIIDPQGIVRYMKLGAMTLDEMNTYLAEMQG